MMAHLSSLLHSFLHSLIMSILGKTSFSVSVGGSHVNVYTGSFLSFGFFFFEVIIMRRNDVRLRERERERDVTLVSSPTGFKGFKSTFTFRMI